MSLEVGFEVSDAQARTNDFLLLVHADPAIEFSPSSSAPCQHSVAIVLAMIIAD